MNYIQNLFKKNFYLDLMVVIFLSHIYYRITFIDNIEVEFDLIKQIKENNVTSTNFFVESPTYTLIGLFLDIENLDIYKSLIYVITLICFLLIIINIQYLNRYSTIFLFGGWLVTCSWFFGYVDIISVTLMTIICRNILQDNIGRFNMLIYFILLSINHNAISLAVSLIFLILVKRNQITRLSVTVVLSQIIGNSIIQFYLNYIGFSGRGRVRFIFNDNVIEDATSFVGENILIVLWSGFLGISFLILLTSNNLSWDRSKKIIVSTLIALFFTSIALDTSRIFSLLIVPIIIFTLHMYKEDVHLKNKLSLVYTVSIFLHFFIGIKYFYGEVLDESPMQNIETFYDFIPRVVNSLMSNIWK
jgi:hypothetical protein